MENLALILKLLKTQPDSAYEFGLYRDHYLILWHRGQKDYQKADLIGHSQPKNLENSTIYGNSLTI